MDEQQPIVVSGWELWEWRNKAFASARVYNVPLGEVDWLLQAVTDLDSLQLRLELFKTRSQIPISLCLADLETSWQQRLQTRLPVQYIAGKTTWRHFELEVSSSVLIPRPETECLIDLLQNALQDNPHLATGNWVDMGTGSGAIALGLADTLPHAQVYAVDYSHAALAIAKKNAAKYGFTDRIKFIPGSWWEPLATLQGQFTGMVSNPPYIPTQTVQELQPEVVKHEPHLALDGGDDGLDDIRNLIETSPLYLIPGGLWLIEMMAGQAKTVSKLLAENGNYQNIQIYPDLAGIDRFVMCWKC